MERPPRNVRVRRVRLIEGGGQHAARCAARHGAARLAVCAAAWRRASQAGPVVLPRAGSWVWHVHVAVARAQRPPRVSLLACHTPRPSPFPSPRRWLAIIATGYAKFHGWFPDPNVALTYADWGGLTQMGFNQYISNERAIIMIAHTHALGVSFAAAFGPQVLGDSLTLLDGEEDEVRRWRRCVPCRCTRALVVGGGDPPSTGGWCVGVRQAEPHPRTA